MLGTSVVVARSVCPREGKTPEYDDGCLLPTSSLSVEIVRFGSPTSSSTGLVHVIKSQIHGLGTPLALYLGLPSARFWAPHDGRIPESPSGSTRNLISIHEPTCGLWPAIVKRCCETRLEDFQAPMPISIRSPAAVIPSHESFRGPETRYRPVGNLAMNPQPRLSARYTAGLFWLSGRCQLRR